METNAFPIPTAPRQTANPPAPAAAFAVEGIPGLPALWNLTKGTPEVCVAVIDGAVDTTHSCFRGASLETVDHDGAATEHGTHVASILFGQHAGAVRGIAPHCRGLLIPVFREERGVIGACSQLDLARAIGRAADLGAHIINVSGGEYAPSGGSEVILAQTIARCARQGILLVAAAGNDGCPCVHVPAAEPSVLVVGAMDAQNLPLGFSNWGEAYRHRGILAPGADIAGALPGERLAAKTGTSFATPIAAGVVALLASLQCKRGATPDPRLIARLLLDHASPCDATQDKDCRRVLAGRLRVSEVLAALTGQPPGRVPAPPVHHFMSTLTPHSPLRMSTSAYETQDFAPAGSELAGAFFPASPYGPPTPDAAPAGVHPSECGCQKSAPAGQHLPAAQHPPAPQPAPATQLVYALGELGYEFRSQASRDSFQQLMDSGNPNDPVHLLALLDENPEAAEGIIWTLNLDNTPLYAIMPVGGFAADIYNRLRDCLRAQVQEGVQRVSVPGIVYGKVKLMSGQELPVIVPKGYGMYSWSTPALVQAVLGEEPGGDAERAAHLAKHDNIHNFLDRVYYELRNLGTASQDRALNYAATNAFQVEKVFHHALSEQLELDSIDVEKSPISRPNSDCWDVKLLFFHPLKRQERSRRIYRFTVDVSNVIPVTIGKMRSWNVF